MRRREGGAIPGQALDTAPQRRTAQQSRTRRRGGGVAAASATTGGRRKSWNIYSALTLCEEMRGGGWGIGAKMKCSVSSSTTLGALVLTLEASILKYTQKYISLLHVAAIDASP